MMAHRALRIAARTLRYARAGLAWKLRGEVELSHPPEEISIELTNSCNFSCSFCPQSDPAHRDLVPRSMLATTAAETILRRLREGGVKTDVMHWTLDGEPFLNPRFAQICALAVDHAWRHFLFATNGFYCTPTRLASMPRSASYLLHIDFCSDKALFEAYRGNARSWRRIRDNVRALLEDTSLNHVAVQITDISSVAIRETDELEMRLDALKGLFDGLDRIGFATRSFHNWCGDISGIVEENRAKSAGYNLCPYPWISLYVASNGDVVACCRDMRHKSVLGNLLETDLATIWNGKEYQRLRASLLARQPDVIAACQSCDMPHDSSKFRLGNFSKVALYRLGLTR